MSLNFQFGENYKTFSEEEIQKNDTFIWGCMMIDLGDITEKNYKEWYWRYCFRSKLNGSLYRVKHGENYLDYIPTVEEVKRRIGLKTNVSDKTRLQFVRRVIKNYKP